MTPERSERIRNGIAAFILTLAVASVILTILWMAGCKASPVPLDPGTVPRGGQDSDPTKALWWLALAGGLFLISSGAAVIFTPLKRAWIGVALGLFCLLTAWWAWAYQDQMIWIAVPSTVIVIGVTVWQIWDAAKERTKKKLGATPPNGTKLKLQKGLTL